MNLRSWRAVVASTAGLFVAVLPVFISAAQAATVPFTDPYSNGLLTLCGRNNQPVTSGSLLTEPFVWSAVSSSAATPGYTRAYLTVFQPIEHVDPAAWSGNPLTVEAQFSNANHPKAQATNADNPLLYEDRQFPPRWDNLYELRMFFTAPGQSVDSTRYPIAVIRVSGYSWTLVEGGTTPCNSGTAVSYESSVLPKSELNSPRTIVVGSGIRGSRNDHASTTTPSNKAGSATSGGQPKAQALGQASTGASHGGGKGGSGLAGWAIALIALLAALAIGAALVAGLKIQRKRHSPVESTDTVVTPPSSLAGSG